MFLIVLLVVACANAGEVHFGSFYKRSDINEDLAECTVAVVEKYFEWQRLILVVKGSVDANAAPSGLTEFLKGYEGGIVLRAGSFKASNNTVVIRQFILYVRDFSELLIVFNSLHNRIYDSSGRYVIVCVGDDELKCDYRRILNACWERYIHNVVLLLWKNSTVSLYEFEPFSAQWCEEVHPFIVDTWTYGVGFKRDADLFTEKMKDLHGCDIVVSTFEAAPYMLIENGQITGGIDGCLIKEIAAAMNFKTTINIPEDGEAWGSFDGNVWSGALGDVVNGTSNMTICAGVINTVREKYLQISRAYNTIDLIWAAPQESEIQSWKKLLLPYEISAWIAISSTYITIIILIKALERIDGFPKDLTLTSWLLFMGQPLVKIPKKNIRRVVLLLWIWFTFFIRSSYQSSLIEFLKDTIYEDNFERLKQGIDAGFRYGGGPNLDAFFYEYEREIYENFETVDAEEQTALIRDIANDSVKFLLAVNEETVMNYIEETNGTVWIHVLEEKFITSPQVIFLRKFSPLTHTMDKVISRLSEAGFIDHFTWKYSSRSFLKILDDDWKVDRIQGILMVENLKGCFSILTIGMVIALIVFTLEVIRII